MSPGLALAVALAGGLGSLARWATSLAVGPTRWPYATVTVNLVGALAIGLVAALCATRDPRWRIVLATGFLGGFTTFSALALDAVTLIERRAWGGAALYLALTVVGGLAACAGGLWLGRQIVS